MSTAGSEYRVVQPARPRGSGYSGGFWLGDVESDAVYLTGNMFHSFHTMWDGKR